MPNYRTFQYLHTLEGGIVQNDRPTSFPFVLTPDSQRLIIVGLKETLNIWDLRTGFLQTLPSDQPTPSSRADKVCISPDGQRCYIAYSYFNCDKRGAWIQIQDTATGQIIDRFNVAHSSVGRFTMNSDETLLALADDHRHRFEVWDVHAKRLLHQGKSPNGYIISLRLSADGQRLLLRDYDGLTVYESQTGTLLYNLKDGYRGLHLRADSDMALGVAEGGLIRQWDLKTGEIVKRWPMPKFAHEDRARLFSPDGNILCSVSTIESEIKLWDWRTGELLSSMPTNRVPDAEPWLKGIIPKTYSKGYRGSGHPIYEVQFTPDGCFIVTSGGDYTIRTWGTPAKDPSIPFYYPEPDARERIETLRTWAIQNSFAGMFE